VTSSTSHQPSQPTGKTVLYEAFGKSIYLTESGGIVITANSSNVIVMLWNKLCGGGILRREVILFTIATADRNTLPFHTPSGWPPPGSSHLSEVSVTATSNALAETINGLYKTELIHQRGPWRSFEAVELATLARVDWVSNRRLMEPMGNIPPAEAEARYYAMQGTMPKAA